MPSSFSASLRFEKQGVGENLNTWGVRLNSALDRIDKAVAGVVTVATTGGVYTLSTANGADDEARAAILLLTGTGGTVVVPSVSKLYTVRNSSTGNVVVTTGAGATVTLVPGDVAQVVCDGVGVYAPALSSMATKAYVDATAWAANTGVLPGQVGNAGTFLTTNGAVASWRQAMTSDLGDIAAYTAARRADALAFAIAF